MWLTSDKCNGKHAFREGKYSGENSESYLKIAIISANYEPKYGMNRKETQIQNNIGRSAGKNHETFPLKNCILFLLFSEEDLWHWSMNWHYSY